MTASLQNDTLSTIPKQWLELNALWEKKKMPQKNFCKIHGINYSQFTTWRNKIVNARNAHSKNQQFAPLTVTTPEAQPPASLPINATIKINLPDGISLFIPSELDEKKLLLILSTLRGQ